MPTQEEIIDTLATELNSKCYLTFPKLQELRKWLDEMNSAQQSGGSRQGDMPNFKEKLIELLLGSISNNPITLQVSDDIQRSKTAILEILEREFTSTKHNNALFSKLFEILQRDNENVAIQASKAMDTLIKKISESSGNLDRTFYIKLFELLKQKTEFLLKLSDHVKDVDYGRYRRAADERLERPSQPPLPNYKSLKFLNQLPNLFVHLMAYVDVWREGNDESKVKDLLRESISNIIQALRKTPYHEFYEQMTQDFNSELFGVMTKLLQFLFILLKNDKESERKENPNKYLKHHMQEQVEYIKMHEVLMNYIHLLKNCPDDFQISRYEIVNRLKLLMNNLSENRLKKEEATDVIREILNEETIFGRNKFLGEYSKNAICNFWIDILRSPILLHHMFPLYLCNLKAIPPTPPDEFMNEFQSYFAQVERLFESTFRTIFDNSLYLSVQERSLELMHTLIDKMFKGPSEAETINHLNSCSATAKRCHEIKLNLMTRVLNVVAQRFGVVKNVFKEISMFVKQHGGSEPNGKRDSFGEQKMEHVQVHTLPSHTTDEEKWEIDRADFIESASSSIDSSLLTLPAVQNKFLVIYEQEEELSFNSHPIKLTNYYNYMKDAKIKVVDKCITVANKIVEIFINQNTLQHSQSESTLIRSVYYYTPVKRTLSEEQCTIMSRLLRNGLKVFQTLHDYNFHQEDPHKKGHLKSFMTIFAQVYDPINFRDIFEPNMELFFRQLLKYAKHCSEYCLQWVLIEPFCSISNVVQFNKNIVELLIYNLVVKLEHSSDQLDPFHEYYEYRDDYFSLLQKLIRFPFRCLSRYNDDSFIRNYFRQIVLFLVKKAHISKFSLDYLHLMRTLFKNILYNSNKENTSPLFNEFFAICSKSSPTTAPQQTLYSAFVNVNVLENLHKLFETGIPELADIVTQLIIMLPLKSKHIIQYAKQGFIVKPLLHCLCMMADYNYTLRTIKTFEIIVSHSSSEEISQFMDGIKDRLINRLLQIVSDSKPNELKPDKMSQDLSSLSLKLLAKLGSVPRLYQQPIAVEGRLTLDRDLQQFQLVYADLQQNRKLKSSMFSAIEYSIEIFNKLLDQYYQCHILVSVEVVETAFNLLRGCLPLMLENLHPMSEKLIAVFSSLLSLHSKYITISPNLLSRIRDGVRSDITKLSENVTAELSCYGLTNYSKLFIKCLVVSLMERVLITREDYCIAEIAQQPKGFLWSLLQKMLKQCDIGNSRKDQEEIYAYVIGLLLSQAVMINNTINVGQSESRSNYVLPYKHAALSVLLEMLDMAPERVLYDQALQIIEGVFVSTATIPDILNLKVLQYPGMIAEKLFGLLLRKKVFMTSQVENSLEIFTRVLENLLSSSSEAHRIAMSMLNMMSQYQYINVCELLFGKPWSEVEDTTCQFTSSQAKFALTALRDQKNAPIAEMVKKIERILNKVEEKNLHGNENNIRLMTNAFRTLEWLISIKCRGKVYQAVTVITKKQENGRKQDFKEDEDEEDFPEKNFIFNIEFAKLITIASSIIGFNENIFGANVKIILDATGTAQPAPAQQPPAQAARPAPNVPQMRNRENPPAAANSQQNQQSINPNTYFDDEEYRLNIEDIDMEIRIWGQLIASIVNFLKTTLLNDNIFHIVKTNSKKKNERSPILEQRSNIIFTLFNLVARVDRTVRTTAYHALKELLLKQEHPKELLSNDDKLKNILRPILICLQHDFKKFMPSFLYVFRKILKLLTQCFNNALIIKLLNHLSEIEKAKDSELTSGVVRAMNYAELTHEAKCISSLLGLFQHLSFAYQSTSPKHTINSIQQIMSHTIVISRYFAPKLGRHTIKILFKENLAKLINTMSPWFSVENLFGDAKKVFLQTIAEIIKMPQSYAIREKITRDVNFADRILDDKHQYEDYLTILEILKTLSKYNTHWLRKNPAFAKKLQVRFDRAVTERIKGEERAQQFPNRSEVRLLCKILIVYMRENPEDTTLIFDLARALRIRSTIDFNFLRMFYKYEVPKLYSVAAKRTLFLQFVEMMKSGSEHIETKVVCSFYIIYPMLMKSNEIGQTKEIFTSGGPDEPDPIKSFIDLMKFSLQIKQLHNRQGVGTDRSSNNYRVAIEVLQLSSFVISPLKNELADYKRELLSIIWGLLKVEDKMLKNYAFICTSNFIRIFNIDEANKVLSIYLTLLRGLEALTQYDYEVGALNKKALNILIPYWLEHQNDDPAPIASDETNMTWITWTLRMLHEDTNEPFRLVRFWEIVVKNHEIFQQFRESKFETQMINSMQWLMVTSNPSSQNPLVKKIASDLSFIYIQWKYRDIKKRLDERLTKIRENPNASREQFNSVRKQVIDESMNEKGAEKAAEICLNFFIKVAFFNSLDKEDKEIMKRSLYLLKKMLILWPGTKKKFDQIKVVVQKLKNMASTQPMQDPPLRFHYTLLSIMVMMLEFESDSELVGQLDPLFKLFELGQFSTATTQRNAATLPPTNNAGFTIYTINNPYLLHMLIIILRRLVKVAYAYRDREESVMFLREMHCYVREGLDAYVMTSNRNRAPNPPPQRPTSTRSILKIEIVISLVKILFDFDPSSIEPCLNNLKQVASIFKKFFEQRTGPIRPPESLNVPEGTFREMLAKESIISTELITPQNLIAADENFERETLGSYAPKRLFLVIVMRILTAKFNSFHVQDRTQILDQMILTHDKLPDPDLKMEIINLWKCMFIGADAFPEKRLPERYEKIGVINFGEFPLRKVFFYLFEDNSKFFEHFERRKIKPNDPTYHVNEKIHEELLTRSYFDFLCHFIRTYDFSQPEYLEKIKIFVLYACKVCEPAQLKPVFDLIERSYSSKIEVLYMLLFEDFKELNCAEEYLQGDEVMLFFTRFLMQIATRQCEVSVESFGVERVNLELLNNYQLLLKSDQSSEHYNRMISQAFALSVSLLPECPQLPKIITQYLLKANLSHTWGMALLKIVVQAKCLSPEQLNVICTKICEWGLLQRQLEASSSESAKWVLDELHRLNGDKDTIYGYRMTQTDNEWLKEAYVQLQQREYYKTLRCIDGYLVDEKPDKKRERNRDFLEELESIQPFSKSLEKTFASDVIKECYKNLNQWDNLAKFNANTHDMETRLDGLFSCREDKERIKNIVGELDSLDYKWLPYYYGRSLLNFMDQTGYVERTKESSKEINVSMTYALLEWLCLPRNAKHKQNEILVRTQCLLELEEGFKIKEESITVGGSDSKDKDAHYDALTRVVQSIFNEINTWRERLPHKFENMTIWRTILEQRNIIFVHLKKRMHELLDNLLRQHNISESAESQLVPYTDIEWNRLRLIKQQRIFGIFNIKEYATEDRLLYFDELFLKIKERFYFEADCRQNYGEAARLLLDAIKTTDDPLYRTEYQRLKARLLLEEKQFKEASNVYAEAVKSSEEQLGVLWRDWFNLSFKAYMSNCSSKVDWLKSAIATLPNALKHSPQKTRLQLAQFFRMLYDNPDLTEVNAMLESVIEELPIWTLLLWVPQIFSISNSTKSPAPHALTRLLHRLGTNFPQPMFYVYKQFKLAEQKMVKEYGEIRKENYCLYSKLENLVNLLTSLPSSPQGRIPITHLGSFSRCFASLHIPVFDIANYRTDLEGSRFPFIVQISENIQTDIRNNKSVNLITFLGSDGKEYSFRIEKRQSSLQNILSSQCIDILNSQLELTRESFIRKLRLGEVKKVFISEEVCLVATSPYTVSLLDILNEHMSKTSFGEDYPDNDKSYQKIPRSEMNRAINRRMKDIVPNNLLEQYFMGKANTLDDYYLFRKQFALAYAPTQLLQYVFGNESVLSDFVVTMTSATVNLDNFKVRPELGKISPYSVRLSRNIQHFLTDTAIMGGVLPAITAAAHSFLNNRLFFQEYLDILMIDLVRNKDFDRQAPDRQPPERQLYERQAFEVSRQVYRRVIDLVKGRQESSVEGPAGDDNSDRAVEEIFNDKSIIPETIRVILQTAKRIGETENIPSNLKYWF